MMKSYKTMSDYLGIKVMGSFDILLVTVSESGTEKNSYS